jgi:hypothetical protein
MNTPPPEHSLPPCAHEVMRRLVPGLDQALADTVREVRAAPAWAEHHTVDPSALINFDRVQDLLTAHARSVYAHGGSEDEAHDDANFLGQHVFPLLNFELHRRKLFWVDDSLAWMLLQTCLDIEGQALRLPFPCVGLVFTDRASLDLAESLLTRDPSLSAQGHRLRVLSVFATKVAAPEGVTGLNLSFHFDAHNGRWPYLVSRDLFVRAEDTLDAILDSHFPEVQASTLSRDPIFSSPELKRLVHLVINALLYATSLPLPLPVRESPLRQVQRSAKGRGDKKRARVAHRLDDLRKLHSAEDVFFLPGKISISQVQRFQELEKAEAGRSLMARFMVRGHWRRANPSWENQGLRWVAPYWKGPDMAAVIEREYRLRP